MLQNNPYRKGTVIWKVMEVDWHDLTIFQIAEVLGTTVMSIRDAVWRIRKETGFTIPHTDGRRARWECET